MGSSKGGANQGKRSGKAAADITKEVRLQSDPGRREYFADLLKAVEGNGAAIPTADNAYRASLAGTESSLAKQKATYASMGIEDTYAAPRLAEARMTGNAAAADARQAIIDSFQGQAPSQSLAATNTAQQGLISSAQRGQRISAANQAQQQQEIQGGAAAAGALLALLLL